MAKPISTEDRLKRARVLIQKAHEIPAPSDAGWDSLNYAALVKDTLRQARDLLKFLPMTAGVTAEQKIEVQSVMKEIEDTDKEILRKSLSDQ
jgi:hypothetical protein